MSNKYDSIYEILLKLKSLQRTESLPVDYLGSHQCENNNQITPYSSGWSKCPCVKSEIEEKLKQEWLLLTNY